MTALAARVRRHLLSGFAGKFRGKIFYFFDGYAMPMARRRTKKRKSLPAKVSKLRKLALVTRAPPRPEYRRVLAIALALPGVEECTTYGTPGLKVKGKILSRLRTEAEGALAL